MENYTALIHEPYNVLNEYYKSKTNQHSACDCCKGLFMLPKDEIEKVVLEAQLNKI